MLEPPVMEVELAVDPFRRLAALVDQQNANDPSCRPTVPDVDDHACLAICDLVFKDGDWPSGPSDPVLHMHPYGGRADALRRRAATTPTRRVVWTGWS